ncbi:MAG: ATP-binding protein [Pseudomonadota bacterium]
MQKRKFIDRKEELKKLKECYNEKSSQFVVLYGRRRVGKSFLLRHFCEGEKHLYFTGRRDEALDITYERFTKAMSEALENPILAKIKVSSWDEIFKLLDDQLGLKKLIIVLDEFQWMHPKKSQLISILQEKWDNEWKHNSKIFLVLCGSIISFMEKEILSEKSPLYGRRTFSFELEPMAAPFAKGFFLEKSIIEQCKIIMTLGGVPSYLELIRDKQSFAQNINRIALTKDGYLVDEIRYILREQVKVPANYQLLLETLSRKSCTRAELAKEMQIKNSGALNLYLKNLTDLQLVRHRSLITKKNLESLKSSKYFIWDEYLRFYFTFILPNMERIRQNVDDWLYDAIMAPKWENYCGYSFELFCWKNIKTIISILGIKKVFQQSGSFWQKQTKAKAGVQIDLVIERTDGITHIGECKWSSGKIGMSIIEELKRKKDLYPNPKKHTLKTLLITTHGVTEQVAKSDGIDDVITLNEMF